MITSLQRGMGEYLARLRDFSRNARLVLVYASITGLAFGVFQFLYNFYVISLGYDERFIGTLQTVASLSAIVMAIPAAYIAERFSQKRLMVATAAIAGISYLGMVLFPMTWSLILFRMLAGIAMSVRQVATAPFLMANTKEGERQWVFSFEFGLLTVASFFGNLLGGMLPTWLGSQFDAGPTDALSYRLALGSMVFVAILAMGPLLAIRSIPRDPDRQIEMPWVQMWTHRKVLSLLLLPQLIIGLGAGLMQPFMNIYLRNVYDKPDPLVSLIFAIGGLAMAVAQFAGAPLADRKGKIQTVILSQAWSIPFLILLGAGAFLVPSGLVSADIYFWVASFSFMVRLALMNLSSPVYQTFLLEQVPADVQALAASLNSISFQFGWFIMPQVSGWLQYSYGDFGFIGVFGGVVIFYVTAIALERRFFWEEAQAAQRRLAQPFASD